jgi:hypothetical protein
MPPELLAQCLPQLADNRDRLDAGGFSPGRLIAVAVNLTMVRAASAARFDPERSSTAQTQPLESRRGRARVVADGSESNALHEPPAGRPPMWRRRGLRSRHPRQKSSAGQR